MWWWWSRLESALKMTATSLIETTWFFDQGKGRKKKEKKKQKQKGKKNIKNHDKSSEKI